jgi:UDP-N-acetylglucosamine:LPS N-acetylglucosamine transferase
MPARAYAVMAGGGTAGHVIPGLAVARALMAHGHPAESLVFVGSAHGIENRIVPEAGFPMVGLPGRGIQRRLTWQNVTAALGLVVGVIKGIGLIRRLRPRVVVVLGGFASVPCIIGSVVWRVPMVVAEQNARAGAANRLAGRFAKAAAVAFPETDLPRKVVTGNPVRPEILDVDRVHDRDAARKALDLPIDRFVLAVFSGSLGARRINEAVRAALPRWADRTDLAIRHVIGSRDWDELGEPPSLPGGGLVYRVVRYEDRMDLLLAAGGGRRHAVALRGQHLGRARGGGVALDPGAAAHRAARPSDGECRGVDASRCGGDDPRRPARRRSSRHDARCVARRSGPAEGHGRRRAHRGLPRCRRPRRPTGRGARACLTRRRSSTFVSPDSSTWWASAVPV